MDENTLLRIEIDRLNKTISVLLDHIETIKLNNAVSFLGNTPLDERSTISEKGNGTLEAMNLLSEKGNSTSEAESIITEKGKATPYNRNTVSEKGNGTPGARSTVSEKGNGTSDVSGAKSGTLPHPIEANVANYSKLRDVVMTLFPTRVKHSKYKSITDLMIFLHNNLSATSAEMRKISGLSKPGYAKHYPSLERMGLIRKQPPHKYVLTEKSKEILLGVFGV